MVLNSMARNCASTPAQKQRESTENAKAEDKTAEWRTLCNTRQGVFRTPPGEIPGTLPATVSAIFDTKENIPPIMAKRPLTRLGQPRPCSPPLRTPLSSANHCRARLETSISHGLADGYSGWPGGRAMSTSGPSFSTNSPGRKGMGALQNCWLPVSH